MNSELNKYINLPTMKPLVDLDPSTKLARMYNPHTIYETLKDLAVKLEAVTKEVKAFKANQELEDFFDV